MKRLNHFLLLRWPVLWRSRPFLVLTIAVMAWPSAIGLALLVPAAPATAWGEGQVSVVRSAVKVVLLLAMLGWARFQWNHADHENPWQRHLKQFALNVIALSALLFPSSAFDAISGERIASVMPAAEFSVEYEFHRRFNFWHCENFKIGEDEKDMPEDVDRHLALFGMQIDDEPSNGPADCELPQLDSSRLKIKSLDGLQNNRSFESRIRSIHHEQRIQSGSIRDWLISRVSLPALAVLIVGLALECHAIPMVRRYRILARVGGNMVTRLPKPRPLGLVRDFEHWLLLHFPSGWALEPHRCLWRALLIQLILMACFRLMNWNDESSLLAGCAVTVFYVAGRFFLRLKDHPVPFAGLRYWCRLNFSMLLLSVSLAAVDVVLLSVTRQSTKELIEMAAMGLYFTYLPIASAASIATVLRPAQGATLWLLGMVFALVGFSFLRDMAWLWVPTWTVATVLMAGMLIGSRRSPSLLWATLSAAILSGTMGFTLAALVGLTRFYEDSIAWAVSTSGRGDVLLSSDARIALLMTGIGFVVFSLLSLPAQQMLARFRYAPRRK